MYEYTFLSRPTFSHTTSTHDKMSTRLCNKYINTSFTFRSYRYCTHTAYGSASKSNRCRPKRRSIDFSARTCIHAYVRRIREKKKKKRKEKSGRSTTSFHLGLSLASIFSSRRAYTTKYFAFHSDVLRVCTYHTYTRAYTLVER